MPVQSASQQRPRRIVILNPSATLRVNYVKNPERPIIRRSGQHTGQQRCIVWDSSSLRSQNDSRRGPYVMPVQTGIQVWGGHSSPYQVRGRLTTSVG